MLGAFLHQVPYHVHNGVTVLQVISWAAIGGGTVALFFSWGRILAWLREDQIPPEPRLVRWGHDDGGWYAEVRHLPPGQRWMAQFDDGTMQPAILSGGGRTSWVRVPAERQPSRLVGDGGAELPVPGAQ